MLNSEIIQQVIDYVQADLTAGWTVRPVEDSKRYGVALCVFKGRDAFRRRIVIPQEMIDDAPAQGGASWITDAMRDQELLQQIRDQEDVRNDDPLIVRRPV